MGGNVHRVVSGRGRFILWTLCLAAIAAAGPSVALADAWFPHPATAQWSYHWTDTRYNPLGTTDAVTVDSADSVTCGWQLQWTGDIRVPVPGTLGATTDQPDDGTVCFQDANTGLRNTGWSADGPPGNEPSLCRGAEACVNTLGSTLDAVIWGGRTPVLPEPLLRGASWVSTGGQNGTVSSHSEYLGRQTITVPAFPAGIRAAVTRSQITMHGTPGDRYGSGTRTTWWGYGIGPLRMVFDHVDGAITRAQLTATNLAAAHPPPDRNDFPMTAGLTGTYRWTNPRYLKTPEIDRVTVAAAGGRAARFTATTISGPLRATGHDVFSLGLDGLRATATDTAVTRSRLPRLGGGQRVATPLDLMTYGVDPVLPAYPVIGTVRPGPGAPAPRPGGVIGTSRILGVRTVRVPAGRFSALEVRSVLTEPGHPFGTGVRTMWFSPTRGLVKLVFDHADGSVSTVVLVGR